MSGACVDSASDRLARANLAGLERLGALRADLKKALALGTREPIQKIIVSSFP